MAKKEAPKKEAARAPAPAQPRPAAQSNGERRGQQVDREQIARRAYERFQQRGGQHGGDQDDWLQAERDLGRRE